MKQTPPPLHRSYPDILFAFLCWLLLGSIILFLTPTLPLVILAVIVFALALFLSVRLIVSKTKIIIIIDILASALLVLGLIHQYSVINIILLILITPILYFMLP